jgi:hypothetical protein
MVPWGLSSRAEREWGLWSTVVELAVGVVSGMGSKYRKMGRKVGLEKVRKLGGKVVRW